MFIRFVIVCPNIFEIFRILERYVEYCPTASSDRLSFFLLDFMRPQSADVSMNVALHASNSRRGTRNSLLASGLFEEILFLWHCAGSCLGIGNLVALASPMLHSRGLCYWRISVVFLFWRLPSFCVLFPCLLRILMNSLCRFSQSTLCQVRYIRPREHALSLSTDVLLYSH